MNFIDSYVEYGTQCTDAPKIFHHRTAYITVAAITRGQVYMKYSYTNLKPNIWMIVIAPSSLYRKSFAIGIAEYLINRVDEKIIMNDDFTPENFVDTLVENPATLLFHSEFGAFMDQLNRSYMGGMKRLITNLYDCKPTYKVGRGTGKDRIQTIVRDPFVNILGASNADWLEEALSQKDIRGGFLPRFLMIIGSAREKLLPMPPTPPKALEQSLIEELHAIKDIVGEMIPTKHALEFYDHWFRQYISEYQNSGSDESGFHNRITIYCHKFAMINALVRHSLSIEEIDYKLASKLMNEFGRQTHTLISEGLTFSRDERNRKNIAEIIRDSYPEGIARGILLKRSKMLVKNFDSVIQTLIQEESVEPIYFETKGRPKVVYKWNKNDEN